MPHSFSELLKRLFPLLALACIASPHAAGQQAASADSDKAELCESIQRRGEETWNAALQIWKWAEPGYQEHKSSALLAEMLEQAGFKLRRGVAEIPTAFTASFGEGPPVIGILGEYDALPGLSQTAEPVRNPREGVDCGHACGHHLFGPASASAAIAVAEQIKAGQLKGTIRFYGCPAEEGGAAKAFMVRAGLFDDCDAVLHWHPSDENAAGESSNMARIGAKFRYRGRSSHAAAAPEQGRSALDAVELCNHATQLLREHTPDFTRIHHVITAGGGAPNVIPDFCEVYYYVRHPDPDVARDVYRRLVLCAEAGALATETKLEIEFHGGTLNLLPNDVLGEALRKNLDSHVDLKYNEEEAAFAARLATTLDKPEPLDRLAQVMQRRGTLQKGSTDVGDVSWSAPTAGFTTACWVPGTPAHSWQAVAAGGTTIGRQGMDLAARVLAATAWDLLRDPKLLVAAKEDHARQIAGRKYEPLIESDQKPPLDYRKAPRDD